MSNWIIAGLGNPGSQYEHTRHNVGYWWLDQLANELGQSFKTESRFNGQLIQFTTPEHKIWLVKPLTFMNRSGQSVAALANFYKLKPEQILVVHDELDLPAGTAKFKFGGGHGGQNGLRDIISKLGNNQNFHRLRIGIGHPGDKSQVTGHVLGRASKSDQQAIDAVIDEALRVLPDALGGDLAKAMNRLHSFKG